MMALHSRSRAGPVRSSLGMRVPQTLIPNAALTMLHEQSNRRNRQKGVLTHVRTNSRATSPSRRPVLQVLLTLACFVEKTGDEAEQQ